MDERHLLDVPSAGDQLMWDIYLSSTVLPAVAACDEVGIFPLLATAPRTPAEIATSVNLTTEWVAVLLGVLGALDLVRVQDGHFHLTDASRNFLLPDSPYYRGHTLRRWAGSNQNERLKRALSSTGAPNTERYVVREWKPGDSNVEQVTLQTATMHGLSFPSAVAMARNGDFAGVRRLMDVAGGSGGFAIALAQRYPDMRCTVADLGFVCDVTKTYISQYGVESQVDTLPLNMFYDAWPTGYDAHFLSCVLHDWGLPQRTDLIERSFAALPSGGRLYIHEMLLNDAGDGPVGPALFSLNMRISTQGKQFSAPELRGALESAGFGQVSVQNTYGYFSLISGRKP